MRVGVRELVKVPSGFSESNFWDFVSFAIHAYLTFPAQPSYAAVVVLRVICPREHRAAAPARLPLVTRPRTGSGSVTSYPAR